MLNRQNTYCDGEINWNITINKLTVLIWRVTYFKTKQISVFDYTKYTSYTLIQTGNVVVCTLVDTLALHLNK